MKANKKVSALSLVVEQLTTEKPFDSISVVQCLAREIIGYNKSSDKLIELQKQIDDTKNDKGARKKQIDTLLKELWTNNVKMVVGKGVTKCPIRIALRDALNKENLAEKTVNNILGAVSYALNNKKPYDIHAVTKLAQQKKIDDAKKQATPPASGTTPPATPEKATQYIQQMAQLLASAFSATEARRMLNDEHATTYSDIINDINDIMDLIATLK